jgi:hypothetical protein
MGNERRIAEKNAGAFLGLDGSGGGPIPTPVNAINLGPGEPGPEDEWKIPVGPIDEIVAQDEAIPEPAHEGLLHRLVHKG